MILRLSSVLLVSLTLAACDRSSTAPTRTEVPALAVDTLRVTSEAPPSYLEAPATLRPAQRAVVAAQLTGTILEIATLGQSVAAGDPLVRLVSPETDARLRHARAQLAEAERVVIRERGLVERRVNPPETLLAAEDTLRIAQAATASAEALLSHTLIVAPFKGVVARQHALMGDLATPGATLLVFEATENLRAEGALPESVASQLELGAPLLVRLDDQATPLTGRIDELAPSTDPDTRTVFVKAALGNFADAHSGQFARFLVPLTTTPAVFVPASSLTRFGQMERVFIVVENRAQLRLVKTGRLIGDRLEILAGLNPGESIVITPPLALRDGQPVSPASEQP